MEHAESIISITVGLPDCCNHDIWSQFGGYLVIKHVVRINLNCLEPKAVQNLYILPFQSNAPSKGCIEKCCID